MPNHRVNGGTSSLFNWTKFAVLLVVDFDITKHFSKAVQDLTLAHAVVIFTLTFTMWLFSLRRLVSIASIRANVSRNTVS